MIKIRITSPFRYQFLTSNYDPDCPKDSVEKNIYLAAGEYYHLDPVKDKEEIKFILSPNFVWKNYIYVNTETIPANLKKELKLENTSYEAFTLPKGEEFIPTLIKDNEFIANPSDYLPTYLETQVNGDQDFAPAQEPVTNRFDLTSPSPVKEEEVEEVVDSVQEDLGIVDSPSLNEPEEVEYKEEELNTNDVSRELREKELNDMHYSKVKEVAERYSIEYTNKKKSIELILNLEFDTTND